MRKLISVLAALVLVITPIFSGISEALPACELCDAGVAQLTEWLGDEDGHVSACVHGVVDETTRNKHILTCVSEGLCELCEHPAQGEIKHSFDLDNWVCDTEAHWHACADCAEVTDVGSHTDGDLNESCDICQAAVVVKEPEEQLSDPPLRSEDEHVHDYGSTYHFDESKHWFECSGCGSVIEEYEHYVLCNTPGKCYECGADCSFEPEHRYTESSYDEDYHWLECINCTYETERNAHYVLCNNPGKCNDCGADCSLEPEHGHLDYSHDDYYHWYKCIRCTNTTEKFPHFATCDNPGKCAACGADCSSEPEHRFDYSVNKYDDTKHWNQCMYCTATSEKLNHYVYCNNPGICAYCEAPCQYAAEHNYDFSSVYGSDEEGHWYKCRYCDAMTDKQLHSATCLNMGSCRDCGYPTDDTGYHNADYFSRESTDTKCWCVCNDCGEKVYESVHYGRCTDTDVCALCGRSDVTISYVWHTYDYGDIQSDNEMCWYTCPDCNGRTQESNHYASCVNPDACSQCGRSDVNLVSAFHNLNGPMKHDNDKHWHICADCGETIYSNPHRASCIKPGVCSGCGAKGINLSEGITHNYYADSIQYDVDKHWHMCVDCGQRADEQAHFASCKNPNRCVISACNMEFYGEPTHMNVSDKYSGSGESHWFACPDCGEHISEAAHTVTCASGGKCTVCGLSATLDASHDINAEILFDGSEHWQACNNCSERFSVAAHTLSEGNRCSDDIICTASGCGYVLAATGHSWQQDRSVAASCETAGYTHYTCSECQAQYSVTAEATGHSYGAYGSNGDGTHTSHCENCDSRITNNCNLSSAVIGLMTVNTCPICGYSTVVTAPEPAPVTTEAEQESEGGEQSENPAPEADTHEVITTKVETFVIETVEDGAQALPEEAKVVIFEQKIVPKAVQELVTQAAPQATRVFTVAATVKDEVVQPASAVKLRIPCDEQEVVGMKLVMVSQDGTLVEMEFEIIDGEIVFTTELFGVFVLMPIEE